MAEKRRFYFNPLTYAGVMVATSASLMLIFDEWDLSKLFLTSAFSLLGFLWGEHTAEARALEQAQ